MFAVELAGKSFGPLEGASVSARMRISIQFRFVSVGRTRNSLPRMVTFCMCWYTDCGPAMRYVCVSDDGVVRVPILPTVLMNPSRKSTTMYCSFVGSCDGSSDGGTVRTSSVAPPSVCLPERLIIELR